MSDSEASNAGTLLEAGDLPEGLARVVSASTLIGELDKRCKAARAGGGSSYPPGVAWLVLDETHSHRNQVGFTGLDKLMRAIHDRVRAQLEPSDVTARFGLNSIAILLDAQGGDRDFARQAATLLRAISSNLFEFGEQAIAATASFAARPANEQLRFSEANLVSVARLAEKLTEAGGNRSEVAGAEGAEDGGAPGTMLGQLTKALRDDSLRVVFQPLLATSGPDADRYQVLPRLLGSDGSLIPAARFIPVAAARGVLPALDQWMIAQTISRIQNHLDADEATPTYFMNQSPALVDDAKFFDWFAKEIGKLDRGDRAIVFEFNVIELKSRIREARDVLDRIRSLGVGVSLTNIDEKIPEAVLLKHIPCDFLRMRADFARRMLADEGLTARFEKFIGAAHQAERKLVVPMLEDAEEVSRIWQMDVDLIQGNFIQQPSETEST